MSLDQWLHLIVLIFMVVGAWNAWKAMGKPVRLEGRRYYRQSDGSYRTIWGRPVKNPEIAAALTELERQRQTER